MANTSDTITFKGSDMGSPMKFDNGDGYEICKLSAALDQPGRGKGDLLADQDPAATGSWPHQAWSQFTPGETCTITRGNWT